MAGDPLGSLRIHYKPASHRPPDAAFAPPPPVVHPGDHPKPDPPVLPRPEPGDPGVIAARFEGHPLIWGVARNFGMPPLNPPVAGSGSQLYSSLGPHNGGSNGVNIPVTPSSSALVTTASFGLPELAEGAEVPVRQFEHDDSQDSGANTDASTFLWGNPLTLGIDPVSLPTPWFDPCWWIWQLLLAEPNSGGTDSQRKAWWKLTELMEGPFRDVVRVCAINLLRHLAGKTMATADENAAYLFRRLVVIIGEWFPLAVIQLLQELDRPPGPIGGATKALLDRLRGMLDDIIAFALEFIIRTISHGLRDLREGFAPPPEDVKPHWQLLGENCWDIAIALGAIGMLTHIPARIRGVAKSLADEVFARCQMDAFGPGQAQLAQDIIDFLETLDIEKDQWK